MIGSTSSVLSYTMAAEQVQLKSTCISLVIAEAFRIMNYGFSPVLWLQWSWKVLITSVKASINGKDS